MDVLNQILNINAGGAYGGGKAGGAFDPLTFAMKPQVVIRALCWVSLVLHKKTFPFHTLHCLGDLWPFKGHLTIYISEGISLSSNQRNA